MLTYPFSLQIPTSSHRHFSSLARRLGRIFAHAYFHHREAFEQAEAESSLYARFLALTSKFDLVPSEFLVIPSLTDDEEDEEAHNRDSGFSMRGVARGTSYDPQRRQGHASIQHQLPSSFQDDFPDVPRARRIPLQHLHQQQQQQQPEEIQTQVQLVAGTESPRKMGRNRTHTMVLSEAAGVVDDLAKAAAAAKAEEQKQKEQEGQAARELEVQEREITELEVKEKTEPEVDVEAKQVEETAEGEGESVPTQDVHEVAIGPSTEEPPPEPAKTEEDETPEDSPAKVDIDVPVDVDIAEEGMNVKTTDEPEVLTASEDRLEKDKAVKVEGDEKSSEESSEGEEESEEGKGVEDGEEVKLDEVVEDKDEDKTESAA